MNVNPPVNRFDGGMTADERDSYNRAQFSCHFDNFTKARSLIPYRSSVATLNPTQANGVNAYNFLIMQYDSKLYVQGVKGGGSSNANIYVAGTDYSTPVWSSAPNGADSVGDASSQVLFVEYENVIYGSKVTAVIWSYDPSGGGTFTSSLSQPNGLISVPPTSNGFVKEGKLYFGAGNLLIKKTTGGGNNANWSLALTLPSNFNIVSLCDYGNLLAIACKPTVSGTSNSFVFLWDTSAPTWNDKIDFGNQDIQQIENIDGYIIGISISGNTSNEIKKKMVFRQYSGAGAIQFEEIYFGGGIPTIVQKQKVNNRLYFGVSAAQSVFTDAVANEFTGIWSVGRNGTSAPFSVNMIQKPNNDTVATAIKGFFLAKDYMYIAYLDGSGTWQMSKTDNQNNHNVTAIYRTVINPRMGLTRYTVLHPPMKKRLLAAALTYIPIVADASNYQQIVLKFRVDNGTWQTCFTRSTVGEQVFEAYAAADGTEFYQGRDFEFQIESKGVEVTGLIYKYEAIETLLKG